MSRPRRFVQVVLFGDSLTWSAQVPYGERYADHLERELQARLGPEAVVDAAACGDGGDTAGQALLRVERDVLPFRPDAVLVNLGCNNTIREKGFVHGDLVAVVAGIRRCRARIVLETIPTIVERRHVYRTHPEVVRAGGLLRVTRTQTNAAVRRAARRYGLPLYDRFTAFQKAAAKDPGLEDTLICPDGIHLTAAGNRHFAAGAAEVLAPLLARPARPSRATARAILAEAEENPAYAECLRASSAAELELFLRSAGSWARLLLQRTLSAARRAACLAADARPRERAERAAALAAAFMALQHALPAEAHAPVDADRKGSLRWALEWLEGTEGPEAERLRRHLRRRERGASAL